VGVTLTGFAKAPGWREPRPRAYRCRATKARPKQAAISSPRAVPDARQKRPVGFTAGDTPLRLGAGHGHQSQGGRSDDMPGPFLPFGVQRGILESGHSCPSQQFVRLASAKSETLSARASVNVAPSIARMLYPQSFTVISTSSTSGASPAGGISGAFGWTSSSACLAASRSSSRRSRRSMRIVRSRSVSAFIASS